MSITSVAIMLHTQLVTALPTAGDPYPVKCDLYDAINPILGFVIGQAKGVIPAAGYALLFFLFIGLGAMANRMKGILRSILLIIVALLAIGNVYGFIQAISPNAC